jgi:radical SAM superfamily enzyme YgiQ (UPF0313 family)
MKHEHRIRRYGTGPHPRRVHLVAPRHPESFWSLAGTVELYGARTLMPSNALAVLMALTPPELDVEYTLGDENIAPPDPDIDCDLVAVTGGTLHAARIAEICRAFRARGIPVALGGTYASLNADLCDGLADFLFVGEAERTWPEFLRHWVRGEARPVYRQDEKIDLRDSPAPDWSLIDPGDYLNIPVQTSRGCPHSCDFCDVIQYVGRVYRVKSIDQIMAEIRAAHALGCRNVFFSDDNFLGDKAFTRELLGRVIEWNAMQARPLSFATQITVRVADDDSLLRLFADARFSVLFVGVETVRRASLEEVGKRHNLERDPAERLRAISRYGILPFVGLMVGFDHDDATVFDELHALLDASASPIAGISLLNAPRNTPLYLRLEREGRLVGTDFSGEWQLETNVVPKLMTREELAGRYWDLFRRIYRPDLFARRLAAWLDQIDYSSAVYPNKRRDFRLVGQLGRLARYLLFGADREIRRVFTGAIWHTLRKNPRLLRKTITSLLHFRHFHDFVNRERPARGIPRV